MIDKIDNMVNWLQRSLMSKVLFSAGVAIIILHHLGVFYLPVLIYQAVFLLVIIPLVLFLIGVTILWINAFIIADFIYFGTLVQRSKQGFENI